MLSAEHLGHGLDPFWAVLHGTGQACSCMPRMWQGKRVHGLLIVDKQACVLQEMDGELAKAEKEIASEEKELLSNIDDIVSPVLLICLLAAVEQMRIQWVLFGTQPYLLHVRSPS